ncbi:MAG: AZOBR_p60025 family cell surface glycopolymer formation protein [Phototrophicaceae bacterium]
MRQSNRTALRPWLVAVLLGLAYSLLVIAINSGDPLALVTIGTRFSEGIPEAAGGTEGYDGQFVYFIASDPGRAPDLIRAGGDVPAYRFQRILLPALARAASFGSDNLIPWALLAINLGALGLGTAALEALLVAGGVSRWYALGYALSLAALGTVRLALPEPLAYGLALTGLLLATRDRWLWAAVVFALAGLAKETALVFPAAAGLLLLARRRWLLAVAFGLMALAPFIAWQAFLYSQFNTFGVGSGGAGATAFTLLPFGGVLAIVAEGVQAMNEGIQAGNITLPGGLLRLALALSIFAVILVPFALLPTVWGLRRCWQTIRAGTFDLFTALLLLNALVMLFVPFSTYREPLGILRFIAGLQIAVILFAAQHGSRRALRYTPLWASTMLFLLLSDLAGGTPG